MKHKDRWTPRRDSPCVAEHRWIALACCPSMSMLMDWEEGTDPKTYHWNSNNHRRSQLLSLRQRWGYSSTTRRTDERQVHCCYCCYCDSPADQSREEGNTCSERYEWHRRSSLLGETTRRREVSWHPALLDLVVFVGVAVCNESNRSDRSKASERRRSRPDFPPRWACSPVSDPLRAMTMLSRRAASSSVESIESVLMYSTTTKVVHDPVREQWSRSVRKCGDSFDIRLFLSIHWSERDLDSWPRNTRCDYCPSSVHRRPWPELENLTPTGSMSCDRSIDWTKEHNHWCQGDEYEPISRRSHTERLNVEHRRWTDRTLAVLDRDFGWWPRNRSIHWTRLGNQHPCCSETNHWHCRWPRWERRWNSPRIYLR